MTMGQLKRLIKESNEKLNPLTEENVDAFTKWAVFKYWPKLFDFAFFFNDGRCFDRRTLKQIPGITLDGSISWGKAVGLIYRFHGEPW